LNFIQSWSTIMQRRHFIRIAGSTAVVGAALGAGALYVNEAAKIPPAAVAAWAEPSDTLDIRRWVLSYALLAPNPHNLQPWMADLSVNAQITLSFDPQRRLPATDPFGRQIMMGAGAFLELLTMAAAEKGYRADWTLFPAGAPQLHLDNHAFAVVRLTADSAVKADPLFKHVLLRRTDRRAYDPAKPVDARTGAQLAASVQALPVRFGLSSPGTQLDGIRTVARQAWRIELTTEATLMESLKLLRVGGRAIDQHRDGINITSPMLLMLSKVGLFDTSQFPAPDSSATTAQLNSFDAITATTPAYLWITTQGNRREQQIDAGRAYVRLNLMGTALGLVMHPNEQSLQEYPEMAQPYQAIHTLLDSPAPHHTVQMLARLGFLPLGIAAQAPAPRRGLAAQLKA
jgi:hypothetical protein